MGEFQRTEDASTWRTSNLGAQNANVVGGGFFGAHWRTKERLHVAHEYLGALVDSDDRVSVFMGCLIAWY